MKTLCILFVAALALSIPASAQFSKGTLFLGPTIGTNSVQSTSDKLDYSIGNNNKSTDTKTYSMAAGPQLGVFLTDHLILGGIANYNFSIKDTRVNTTLSNNNALTSHTKKSTSTVNAGPFVRYYFFKELSSNMIYAQLNTTLGTGGGNSSGDGNNNVTSTYQSNGSTNKVFAWNAGASIGLTHFFSDVVGLDVALGYNLNGNRSTNQTTTYTKSNATEAVTSSENNYRETVFTHGLSLGVGFHWFLRKMEKS